MRSWVIKTRPGSYRVTQKEVKHGVKSSTKVQFLLQLEYHSKHENKFLTKNVLQKLVNCNFDLKSLNMINKLLFLPKKVMIELILFII